ncbi:MAG: chitobiase/beta-hexosaminidase C-terminal domain-containing protein [bacterium]|nr:chitobiase/beta-hexosaminidase C-terminal domain-containing protein [Myxococcales bacterium]MCB9541047.1 chitobiase/beta-hexosaminidase C-terminal domain-containing protein [Myxococcales bacterium]MCB9553863.1 chitobiase/beta-hexosaminidase C-terminal domain-containing protein [Myxococcales bacterium]
MPRVRLIVPLLFAVFAGCGEEVTPDADRTPPTSTALAIYPAGGSVELQDGQTLRVNTVDLTVRITIDGQERGTILYTTDGSAPTERNPAVGVSPNAVTIPMSASTTVRWRALDMARNQETERRAEIVFDRQQPTLRIEPPPGAYSGQLTVRVTANEAATLYWSVDGSPPLAGAPGTEEAELPANIDLVLPTELRLVAIDLAGNVATAGPLDYEIDVEAPTTTADPGPGRYLGPIEVVLGADDPDAVIRYTTDGSDPGTDSARYAGPVRIDRDVELKVRAYDPGGNAERVRTLPYFIGPRPPVAPTVGSGPERFPLRGGLELATALIEVAGPLAGRADAPSTGADWATWAIGRTAIDAVMWQGGLGPHAMNGAPIIDISAAGLGAPDANLNGSNLDETWFERVELLAERAGESRIPDSIHPPGVLLETADAALAAPLGNGRDAAGLPLWVDDYGLMRWAGVPADGRATDPALLAAGLDALATRARSALAVDHPIGEDLYARRAAPVVGLRCVGCHGVGIAPTITTAGDLEALGLLDGDAPRLLALLRADEPHPVDPATDEQVAAVAAWIEAGAMAADGAERRPGPDPREGFLGLLSIEHAGELLATAMAELVYDVERNQLSAFDPEREQYHVGEATVIVGAGPTGTPQLQQAQVVDRTFDTAAQARLLAALAAWVAFGEARPDLFTGILEGSAVLPATPALARTVAETIVARLLTRTLATGGGLVASWHPDAGMADRVEALALAEAAVALRAAGAALGDPAATAAADGAVRFLLGEMMLDEGDYVGAWQAGIQLVGPRSVEVQWAVFAALADAAAAGDAAARSAMEALWARLDAMWFDPRAGVWQTTFGNEVYRYTPGLIARILDGLGRAVDAGLPSAEARLNTALERLVIPFVWADTWLSGEIRAGRDVDGDGLPKPQDALEPNGAAPVFRRQIDL